MKKQKSWLNKIFNFEHFSFILGIILVVGLFGSMSLGDKFSDYIMPLAIILFIIGEILVIQDMNKKRLFSDFILINIVNFVLSIILSFCLIPCFYIIYMLFSALIEGYILILQIFGVIGGILLIKYILYKIIMRFK